MMTENQASEDLQALNAITNRAALFQPQLDRLNSPVLKAEGTQLLCDFVGGLEALAGRAQMAALEDL